MIACRSFALAALFAAAATRANGGDHKIIWQHHPTREKPVSSQESVLTFLSSQRIAGTHGYGGTMTVYKDLDYVTVYTASQRVEVVIRSADSVADSFMLHCFFFLKDQNSDHVEVQKHVRAKVKIEPHARSEVILASPTARYSSQKIDVNGVKKKIGRRPYGYALGLTDSDGLFKFAVSHEMKQRIPQQEDMEQLLATGKLAADERNKKK